MTTASLALESYGPLRETRDEEDKMAYHHRPPSSSSPPSSGSEEYSSSRVSSHPGPSSNLESFNDNNRAMMSSRFVRRDSESEATDSSLGNPQAAQRAPNGLPLVMRTDSLGAGRTPASSQTPVEPTSQSFDENNSSESEVVIEEKRRQRNGDGYTIHRYQQGRLLGKGGFAKVYMCTALDTGKTYAVKVVSKANLVKARARQKLQAEIKIHRTLKHEHVCEYKHYFEDRNNCYILLELCHNQSLNEMIKRRKRLTEPEAAYFISQLVKAVKYMHAEKVIHRDLKLGNLFLDKNIRVKVGDLGLATRVEDIDEKRKTICGTPNYIAPEIIQADKSKRGHSFEVDIWSMGVILYTLLIGKPPYEAKDVKATYQRILNNEYSYPNNIYVSETAKNLIGSMLQSNPQDRPSLNAIEAHPFLDLNCTPTSLPISSLHRAPEWRFDGLGRLLFDDPLSSGTSKKVSLPRPRQPFAFRDPNAPKVSSPNRRKEKSERDIINVQRIVRTAMNLAPSSPPKPGALPGFQIYDESKLSIAGTPVETRSTAALLSQPRQVSVSEETIVTRTKSMMISSPSANSGLAASFLHTIGDSDVDFLRKMVEHLETVLSITESRKGSFLSTSQPPYPVSPRAGPQKWVARYVDYTSKYGLGFLLNDGSAGVYFNDATKVALEPHGEVFQYIERRKSDDQELLSGRRTECSIEKYTLSCYPPVLKKKVTLLTHFRNYLLEQQKKAVDSASPILDCGLSSNFVFVKKWFRTKHAVLFRLSNHAVQLVFYDQTEILFTPDTRFITYVDKNRRRATYNFTDDLVSSSQELEKRLKYTKEILHQLLSGQRR